ncbi:MAG: efflux RND transporter periplasmic adaptor subunit [Deltaproteobacteria bacterium]|nr:efflux RND transporter periplasmic adaptor subunit [Deltaproteobacteria bacterium]
MKKIVTIVLVIVLTFGVVLLVKKRQSDLAKAPPADILPVVAETVTLKPGQVTLTTPAMAQVASDLSTTLSTKVTGRVLEVLKKQGDRVKKGDKLLAIDASDLDAKKASLRAKLDGLDYEITVQRENHQRTMQLFTIKGASQEQTRVEEAALANLEKSKESLVQNIREIDTLGSYSTLVAPVAGTVSELLVNSGDIAVPGKPLVRIAADQGLYLTVSLPDSVTPQGLLVNGTAIKPVPRNQAAATGLVQYAAQLPDTVRVVEGQYLNLQVVLFQGAGVLVPMDGLVTMGDKAYILTMEGNLARRTPVTVLHRGSEGTVVAEDLVGRTILVAKPDILLRAATGVPVQATARQGEATAPADKKTQAGGRKDG